jgi:hypothetical protein
MMSRMSDKTCSTDTLYDRVAQKNGKLWDPKFLFHHKLNGDIDWTSTLLTAGASIINNPDNSPRMSTNLEPKQLMALMCLQLDGSTHELPTVISISSFTSPKCPKITTYTELLLAFNNITLYLSHFYGPACADLLAIAFSKISTELFTMEVTHNADIDISMWLKVINAFFLSVHHQLPIVNSTHRLQTLSQLFKVDFTHVVFNKILKEIEISQQDTRSKKYAADELAKFHKEQAKSQAGTPKGSSVKVTVPTPPVPPSTLSTTSALGIHKFLLPGAPPFPPCPAPLKGKQPCLSWLAGRGRCGSAAPSSECHLKVHIAGIPTPRPHAWDPGFDAVFKKQYTAIAKDYFVAPP